MCTGRSARRSRRGRERLLTEGSSLFLFFSNRLGCGGSLLLSLVITAVLIYLLSR
jgi:hypothetical protein